MTSFSIIGAGTMATAIAHVLTSGGAGVQIIARDSDKVADLAATTTVSAWGDTLTGDVVILALPYPAVAPVLESYGPALAGKTVVDITNPLDFSTFDSLVVPDGSSAASLIAEALPDSAVLKAFNTTFAGTLATGKIGENTTTVLIAGDNTEAKATLAAAITAGGLEAVDAGALNRAVALEQIGFLQLTLAAAEKISWTGGLALVK